MTSSERKRRHRRVVAPATDGVAEQDRSELVDAEPADLPTARKSPAASTKDGPGRSAGSDQWWQDQRPPHWE